MSDYRAEYFARKKQVLEQLNKIEAFLTECGYAQEAEGIAAQSRNLENGEFSIVLVGEFSAGKSTFLNALMRERILPSYTRETTATINFLRHKDQSQHGESGCVYYKDGRKQEIDRADIDTISRYVSAGSTDVKVAQEVDHLDLFLDSKFLEDRVMLVDTPGLNGIAKGHKEITRRQIERSSAAIFLFDANQPGSSTDFEVLGELSRRVGNILLVLNKIDAIHKSENETVEIVIEKLKEAYRESGLGSQIPEIWPLSAYQALVARSSVPLDYRDRDDYTQEEKAKLEQQSGLGVFEERLWKFLTRGEKAKQMLLTPVTQAVDVLGRVKEQNKGEIAVLEGKTDMQKIFDMQQELEKTLEELEKRKAESEKELHKAIKEKEKEFFNEIKAEGEQCKERIYRKIDNFTEVEEIQPQNLEKEMKRQLNSIIDRAWENYNDALRDALEMHCESITGKLNDMLETEGRGIVLEQKLELPGYKLGIENYLKKEEKLENELKELDKKLEECDYELDQAMEMDRRRAHLKRQIDAEREKRKQYELDKYNREPAIDLQEREVVETRERGGVIGGLLDKLFGPKQFRRMESYVDETVFKEHERRYNALVAQCDANMEQLQLQLSRLNGAGEKEKQRVYARLEQARRDKAQTLRDFQKQETVKFQELNERQQKRQKDGAEAYFEELLDTFQKECKKTFKDRRKALEGIMADGVQFSVSRQIQQKQEALNRQKKLAETAVNERNEGLRRCKEENEKILKLLAVLLDIQTDLDHIDTDTIAQEEL